MLQEQSRLFQRVLFFVDALLVAASWVLAYYTRFELFPALGIFPLPEWLPPGRYMEFIPWVLIVSMTVFWASGLYIPDRAQRATSLVLSVLKAILLGVIAVAASLSFYRELYFSRLTLGLFGLYTPLLIVSVRLGLYLFLRAGRRRGKYLRRVLIVGAGRVGQRLRDAFEEYPWIGFELAGFLDDGKNGDDILGRTDEISLILDQAESQGKPIQYVYIALPMSASKRIEGQLNELSSRLAHVCLVPDIFEFDILNGRVTDIDGIPIIHLIDEAPIDLRRVMKRTMDLAFSASVLVLLSPLYIALAVAVKLSSPGPIFYRQERMGLNGKTFQMLKFRSMPVNTERKSGAVWARPDDNRATRVGAFLRRTSLDELPQFINVLKGDMSVVGPRPERPVFIEDFRDRVPRYMLRHKMKAGITGWAQVNGWRGNTSIEKRIEFDLYYIQHWSLKLDIKIMLMTIWKGFVHEHAY
ncbi:MAG: undecaprenyl-phosphate glucose phosphotransferase [Bacteroidetes bacterium CG12_big_fil_rev_8_21_14_0_65_60_17]|nr:MAG: undecaprenyl-phosphate glucose phosphotransferase [Bacteroidetes bacterium CG12_big_fil_rev_8_21_14_0_65_60_17]